MAATVTRSPAEMVTEADEIVRKAREVAWPESREAQNAIGHEFACAAETRRVYDALVNEEMDPLHALAPAMGWWDDPQQCAVEYAADQYLEAAKALRNRLAEWKRREGGILS